MTGVVLKSNQENLSNLQSEVSTYFEMAAPKLQSEDLDASQVKQSKIYYVKTPNVQLPIYPSPNLKNNSNNYEVLVFLEQAQVVVCPTENDKLVRNVDNGKYVKTILPVKGWTLYDYVTQGTLVEISTDLYEQLKNDSIEEEEGGCCMRLLQSSQMMKGLGLAVRKHPICIMFGLVFVHFAAECIIFADLITDLLVARTLANNRKDWLFMLTIVFILAPYYIAWAAAFGYLQKRAMDSSALKAQELDYQNQLENNIDGDTKLNVDSDTEPLDENNNKKDGNDSENENSDDEDEKDGNKVAQKSIGPAKGIQIGVLLFSIAPIGVCFLVILDVYLLLEDLLIKPIYLACKYENIREETHAEEGYKKLRRVSEVVAETICQCVLQFCMYVHFSRQDNPDIDISIVLTSLLVSLTVLIVWGTVLTFEAKGYGLKFYEYVTVVLQGSFNFVPFLPAIERGKVKCVNWTNFRFDSHSVGLVSKTLISPECILETIKLSSYSLQKLSPHESRFLGQMLADSPKKPIRVIFSRSRKDVEELFLQFDHDNSRSFDFKEFVQLCAAIRQSDDGVVSISDISKIFSDICDPKLKQIFLGDLLSKISDSRDLIPVVDYSSPIMYALKHKSTDPNLLTFMLAAKVCDEPTWDYYTTTLVLQGRHKDAIVMCEDRGVPIVIEVINANNLNIHDEDTNSSDPYVSVSIADTGQVKRTETRTKTLNPQWNQTLLFTIPFNELPESLDDETNPTFQSTLKKNRLRNRKKLYNKGGLSGSSGGKETLSFNRQLNRLEVHFKVYDFDENDDDDFMGSMKHFIKWTKQNLEKHQKLNDKEPINQTYSLNAQGKDAGKITFRVYISTLRWYIKWGKSMNDNMQFD